MIGLIYPKICMACDRPLLKQEESLCTFCIYGLPKTGFHTESDNPVSRLFWGKSEIEGAASYFHFEKGGHVQQLIHKFKYKGFKEIGIEVGKHYGAELKNFTPYNTADIIVPVPLHKSKQRKRGYNQSEFFARGLSQTMNIPTDFSSVYRAKATDTQTRKSRFERFENVESIFQLKENHPLSGKHILLVDDVVTTGSTLEACCETLKAAGNKVSVVTMACAK
ncbi:MAG: ComF family protein [Bacteroidia bacterium]